MAEQFLIEYNKSRIYYLLALYGMSADTLLSMLNGGRKKLYTIDDISGPTIKKSLLIQIGKIFNKDIYFFIDFSDLRPQPSASIFFRKNDFAAELNMEARRVVCKYEDLKNTISSYFILGNFQFPRKLQTYTISQSAKDLALSLHQELFPKRGFQARALLKTLINSLASKNIFVFEYIEQHNKKEKSNIDGFYLHPGVIVLKRNQEAFNHEIFTLAHELGHYLLDAEDIDKITMNLTYTDNPYTVERWCNDFAFYFIAGEESRAIDSISAINSNNDYCHDEIEQIAKTVHLSQSAIYTHLYLTNKMSYAIYATIRDDLDKQYSIRETEEKVKEETPKGFSAPKPIISDLYIETMQLAYFKGVVGDIEFLCNHFI